MNMNKVEYLAKLEKVLEIPTEERLTRWYGDYGIYEPKIGITGTQVNERIRELNQKIIKANTCKIEVKETLSRTIEVQNPISIEDAIDALMTTYRNGDLVLDADDFQSVEFNAVDFSMEP